jgi:predicted acylesterase/phospholipase RssA
MNANANEESSLSSLSKIKIKNLVISGGGPSMVQTLGILQYLEEKGFLERKSIQTIYATSAGALVALLLSLDFDWETIFDYIIKRPWQDIFPIQVQNLLDAYTKKGLYDRNVWVKCCKPLLDAKDISLDITMKEMFETTGKEFHFYTFEVNSFEMVDISYKSHPDLSLLTALHMTCALPIIICPVFHEEGCYIDGGFMCNYPMRYCLEDGIDFNEKDEKDEKEKKEKREKREKRETETLGIKNVFSTESGSDKIVGESTLLDFITKFVFKSLYMLSTDRLQPVIKNECVCIANPVQFDFFRKALNCMDTRKELWEKGRECGEKFLSDSEKNGC